MTRISQWLSNPKHRAYLYSLAVAAGPLLIAAGILTTDDWDRALDLIGALLLIGTGTLATANLDQGNANPDAR